MVLMDQQEQEQGGILIPENAGGDRPDSGTVISAGKDTGFGIGDHVLVCPYAGIWFRNFVISGYKLWEVRTYGIGDLDEHDSIRYQPGEVVPAVINNVEQITDIQMKQDWCLIKRDPNKVSEGNILLTDKSNYRTHKAEVIAVGPKCNELSPGDRIIYHGPSIMIGLKNLVGMIPSMEGNPDDYCFIKESGVYSVI